MVEEKIAITAIRDMAQEGFIAATLTRIGWNVIYRATSLNALHQKLPDFPGALIFISDDFGEVASGYENQWISLRGRSHPISSRSQLDPHSDFELEELIRSREPQRSIQHIPATTSHVIAISSIGGRTGATSIAITMADQISREGKSVLLVEGNRIHPRISFHFQAHNIRQQISLTQYGFSILEATDGAGIHLLSKEANKYDFIVVDLGPANIAQEGGQRAEDLLSTWVKNSRAKFLLTARDGEKTSGDISHFIENQLRLSSSIDITLALIPSKVLNKREQRRLIEDRGEFHGVLVDVLSKDWRSLEKMESAHSTLALISPKSPLVGDIARYLERGRYS